MGKKLNRMLVIITLNVSLVLPMPFGICRSSRNCNRLGRTEIVAAKTGSATGIEGKLIVLKGDCLCRALIYTLLALGASCLIHTKILPTLAFHWGHPNPLNPAQEISQRII